MRRASRFAIRIFSRRLQVPLRCKTTVQSSFMLDEGFAREHGCRPANRQQSRSQPLPRWRRISQVSPFQPKPTLAAIQKANTAGMTNRMNKAANRESTPKPWNTRYLLLLVSVFAQLISLMITWPLWNVRQDVPHLPVVDFGTDQLPFGWGLVLTLAFIPFRPRLGIWLHFALMLVASLFDQMRAQPQFLATWVLMLATMGNGWKNYVRWFLASLWIWAGLHKAISPDWNAHRAFHMADALGLDAAACFTTIAIVVAVTEILVGLLAWWIPKWGAVGCVMLHVGIAIYLSPLFRDWNYSVLPWNLATAIVGSWILWTCDVRSTIRQRAAFCVFMFLPIGFFVSWLDHGYSHVLYSGSTPQGLITRTDGSVEKIQGWDQLAVPFPNERRTLRQRFQADSKNGDRLHILDPRWALDDLYFIKRNDHVGQVDRHDFLTAGPDSVLGVELDSDRHVFLLTLAGARMLKREKDAMIYAIEFKREHFEAEQLSHVPFVPNLEQIQLSGTGVSDDDLKWLVDLPKLTAVGLNDTAITDRGIEILSRSDSLKTIQVDDTNVSPQALQQFLDSR